MSTSRNIVLITGGNAGIGNEIARQLIADKDTLAIIGCRSLEKGNAALKRLQELGLPGVIESVQLDVDSPDSIKAAAEEVKQRHGKLDVLVNNAGLAWNRNNLPEPDFILACYRTNFLGPHLTTEAFAPLLRKSSSTPRIINVTSGGGSISLRLNPPPAVVNFQAGTRTVHYGSSKAALNWLTADQTVTYGKEGFKVFAVCPGYTESTLGPHNSVEKGAKPTSEGAGNIVEVIKGERDNEHGGILRGEEKFLGLPKGQYDW